jgi:hypothetical protein
MQSSKKLLDTNFLCSSNRQRSGLAIVGSHLTGRPHWALELKATVQAWVATVKGNRVACCTGNQLMLPPVAELG